MEQKNTAVYHKVLERQIKKFLGKNPSMSDDIIVLLQLVSDTYKQYEEDRQFVEHTMDISSQELTATNQELIQQKTALQVAYEQLRMAQAQLEESEKIIAMSKELTKAYQLLEIQTTALQQANLNHRAAIQRAKRIQNALLPSRTKIAENFREFFVFHQAVDVVSGDFYWFSKFDSIKILIVADCTGHGVPGAFMTIMGNSLLEEIINTNKITLPSEILLMLDKKITNSLMQGKDSTHDGMDVSIVAVNDKAKQLTFAGSKHILYHIRNNEMMQIKGSIHPIGGQEFKVVKTFENYFIDYQVDDIFYMTTDGYQSQFSESKGKFMRHRLRDTIMNYYHLPLIQQRPKFKYTFADWKGDAKQTDDILVIGFKP
jgi:serine phosphatase RsbU (regulator of sigma subunit)